jgi:signal peptidase I
MAVVITTGISFYSGGISDPIVAVTTGSMLPIYNGFQDGEEDPIYPFRGDALLIRKVPIDSIKVGDVIVFNVSGYRDPIVHRIIDKWQEDDSYFFKMNGDNNMYPDSWTVSGDDIIGLVVLRIPHVGWLWLAVKTTFGQLIVLVAAVLLLFIGNDSEEENTEPNGINNDDYQDATPKFTSKIKNGLRKLQHHESYIYGALALVIIFVFLGSNIISALVTSPSVKLYQIEDSSHKNNLIVTPSSLDTHYQLRKDHLNQTIYFFPIQIEIQSGGIFNNIESLEIKVNETKGLYRWNTVYNFIGTRTLEGGIVAIIPSSSTSNVTISLRIYSRGLLASSPQLLTFPLTLRSR